LDVLGRVNECLPLAQARRSGREVEGVGAKAAGSQAKARPRPGRRFEEEVDHDLAAQIGSLLVVVSADFDEVLGPVEYCFNLGAAQVFKGQQVSARPLARLGFTFGKFDAHEVLLRLDPGRDGASGRISAASCGGKECAGRSGWPCVRWRQLSVFFRHRRHYVMKKNGKKQFCYDYPRPAVTVDTVIVTNEERPRVLLIRR